MRFRNNFLLLISLLGACSGDTDQNSDKTVFRYNEASGISSLDPAFSKDQASIWPCTQLFNGLVQLDSSLKIIPAIASSWEISDQGKLYTFHLRTDVYFHDNKLFKEEKNHNGSSTRHVIAEDFVFSLNRLVDPAIASPGSWVLNAIERDAGDKLTGIKALNDSTLIIHLSHPFPAFLSLLSMPYCSVVPHEVVEHYGTDFRKHPCGTGPFKFSIWKEGVSLIFLKNKNYFESVGTERLPYLDAVKISFINDKQSAFIEFLKGNLDFISGLDASYKDELLTRDGNLQSRHKNSFRLQTLPYLNTEYFAVLMEGSDGPNSIQPLHEKKIRQALSHGFDKTKMIRFLRNNMGTPGIHGFVPPGMPYFDSLSVTGYKYDPEKARALLVEAGFPNAKGVGEITLSTTSTYLDLCEFIKSEWESLGFKIRIDVNQAAMHRKMVAEQKLAFFRGSWIADYPDAENYLSLFYSKNFAPGGPNYTHYSNKEFDALYELASTETSDSLRAEYYKRMDQMVTDEAIVIILYYDKVVRLSQNNVSGLSNNAMNLLVLKNVRKTPSSAEEK